MKTADLTVENLSMSIKRCHGRMIYPFNKMAFAPRNKFFSSEEEQRANMEKRIAFLHVLEKKAKASGLFMITDEFVKDFIERND